MSKALVSVPRGLEDRIDDVFKLWGFTSKAEFFRHAATVYLNEMEKIDVARKGKFTRVYPVL